jgi:hypothetical protein
MAYRYDKGSTKVNIDLDAGLYCFEMESATGKTRLYKRLKELQIQGEPVVSYSYNDYMYGVDLKELLGKHPEAKVVMVDRYDMFKGLYKDIIVERSKSSTVLIDYKANKYLDESEETCFIEMTANSITVEG